MNRHSWITLRLWIAILLCIAATAVAQTPSPRDTTSFDADWKFHLGDATDAQKPDFAATDWRSLDVPHDFSIEGPPGKDPSTMDGPFDKASPAGVHGGALNAGIAWYRKTFTVPETSKGKHVTIQFDGVYMDSDVWLNGEHLGNHPYGYTSFAYDLTPHLKFGAPNVLAVRVNIVQPCSRWYSGAGIYRHVRLVTTDPIHIAQWGTYVTSKVDGTDAQIAAQIKIRNDSTEKATVSIHNIIVDATGKTIATFDIPNATIAAGEEQIALPKLTFKNAQLWSLESPTLYHLVTTIKKGDTIADAYDTSFGIRTIAFTTDKGFFLNGKHVQIQGVCDHHDLGCLGAAVNTRAIERQLQILKSFGVNAIRTSHNPPAPELLDLCDKMGFVVMDEAFDEWKHNKTKNGYGRFFDEWSERDIVSMLHRDRNHPSIIMWSIGNEIPEQGAKNGGEMASRLAGFCHREDPTRFVTSACSNPGGATKTGFANALDVFGINYNIGWYSKEDQRKRIGSETSSALSSRGEYNLLPGKDGKLEIKKQLNNQCTSYELLNPGWGHTATTSLCAIKDHPAIAGEFVWTGFDYIGEPTPFGWPSRSSYFGIVDLCGFPKDRYYLYQSQWTDKPMVHLLPHWNWEQYAGKEIPVWAFSSGDTVELFLNGKSLGEKSMKDSPTRLHVEWSVPYTPGTLKAVAKKAGNIIATDEIHTAGKPAKLQLSPDRDHIAADGQDLSFVTVKVLDKDGNLCPNADAEISFALDGPGLVAGVDNGDATDHEAFKATKHKAFHGLALVVLQSRRDAGKLKITATADGLDSASADITTGK
jgi:beta-galactosidase